MSPAAGVPVTLNDGKKRSLRFDINRLVEAENRLGSLIELQMALARASVKSLRTALHVALGDDTLTENDIGNLMYGCEMTDMMRAVMKALHDALEPKSNKEDPPPGETGKATTGGPSMNSSLQPAPTG